MNITRTNIIIGIVVLILAVAIPVTVRLAQQQQQLKSRAQEIASCTPGEPISECVTSCPADRPVGTCGGHTYCVFDPEGNRESECSCETKNQTCTEAAPPAAGPPNCNTLGSKRADVCGGQLEVYDTCTPDCKDGKRVYYCTDSRNNNCTNRPKGVFCPAEDSQCAPAQGGNVGVGKFDKSSCGPLRIDNKLFGQSGFTIEVDKPHTAVIQMNNPAGSDVTTWDSRYGLLYTGDGDDKATVSPKDISIPSTVSISPTSHYTFTGITFTPKKTGDLNFFWQMRGPNEPQRFGAQCESTLSITAAAGAPAGTCPVGSPAGFIAGADRKYDCKPPATIGCVSSSDTPPFNGVPADKLTCSVAGQSCFACSESATLNTFPFGQCGICRDNPQTQAQDPKCDNLSARKDDGTCRTKKKIVINDLNSKEFRDECIEAQCVQATRSRDCLVCFGSSCQTDQEFCVDPAKPFCQTTGTQRGFCLAGPPASPSPPGPPPPPPPPAVRTACFFIDKDPITKDSCDDEGARAYATHPMIVPFTLTGSGKKFIFVRFISTTGEIVDRNRVINFLPNPVISDAQCTHLVSGVGTQVVVTATNIGPRAKAKVKLAGTDAEITTWNEDKGEVVASIDKKIEGANALEITRADGKVARAECSVGTTTVAFAAQTQCKKAGDFSADNVTVKIFANVPTTQEAEKPEPSLDQKIKLDKDGKPTAFSPKLEKNKKYSLIVKAPGTLSKRIDFETKSGTKNLEDVTLLAGDIAPATKPDGKINAVDRGEMIRQWNLVKDVARTADFNGDGRVNSIDYACMRGNINQSDEEFSPPTPKAPAVGGGPQPTATPSATPSTSPIIATPSAAPAGILPFRVSFDPAFPAQSATVGDMGTSSVQIIDLTLPQGPGQKTVYVQFFENNVWGPTPPQTASILLK